MKTAVRSLRHQRGLSGLGWVAALLLFGFTILCVSRIVPPYIDNMQIRNGLQTLGEIRISEDEFDGASDSDIKAHLSKFFRVNGLPTSLLSNLKVTRVKGRAYVDLDWEKRVNLISNLDVVVHFKNQFDSLNPADCCRSREKNL